MSNNPYSNPYSSPLANDPYQQNYGGTQRPLAGHGKRFLGALVDFIIQFIVIAPGYGMMLVSSATMQNNPNAAPPPMLFVGLGILVVGGLAVLIAQVYLLATRAQTIGKLVVKTQICDYDTGQPATFVKSFLMRGFVNGLISSIPCVGPIYALVDIFFIFREDRRCIHDLIANTHVLDLE